MALNADNLDSGCGCGDGHLEHVEPVASRSVDQARIERAVREILAAVGEDPDREGLRETPARVARMYAELFGGLHEDPRVHLRKFFTEKCDEVVLVRDISFNSMCEHHMLPFMGKAHVGLSARRPGDRAEQAGPGGRGGRPAAAGPGTDDRGDRQSAGRGVARQGRGGGDRGGPHVHDRSAASASPGRVCVTSAMKGCFRNKPSTRAELMTLIYGDRR